MVSFAQEQVISPQRLAKKLGVSSETIRRWIRQGLESRKVMGKRFTSLEALDRFSDRGLSAAARNSEIDEAMDLNERAGVNTGRESQHGRKSSQVHPVQKTEAA
jgi:transposase-like protein